jgi:3-mercaptopyruvate sulfurtransferase SseA
VSCPPRGQVLKVVEDASGPTKPEIVDARSAPRFNAEVDEPRAGLGQLTVFFYFSPDHPTP